MSKTVYLVVLNHGAGDETVIAVCDCKVTADHIIYQRCRRPSGTSVPNHFDIRRMVLNADMEKLYA